jgi:hypothetical protein
MSFTSMKLCDQELTDDEKSLIFVALNEFLVEMRWERLNSDSSERIESEEEEGAISGIMARMRLNCRCNPLLLPEKTN